MRKFIQGTFKLDYDVADLISYEETHKKAIIDIINWANNHEVYVLFGTSNDDVYLCECDIVCDTLALCKGLMAELKKKLKSEFPKTKLVYQGNGTVLR